MGRRKIDASGWSSVELRHLAALEAVAEERSFGRAATRLGYTQSAVSQQIAALERLAGTRLIHRGGGQSISLTPAGERVRRHASLALSNASALIADLEGLAGGSKGTLRVGTFPSVGSSFLPALLKRFKDLHAEAHVCLTESPSDRELLEQLRLGDLDVAFAMLPVDDEAIEVRELLEDPYVVLVAADSELARTGTVTMTLLAREDLISFQHEERRIAAHFDALGLERQSPLRTDDNLTVNEMVAAGLGVALVPRLSVNQYDPRISAIALDPPVLPRRIGLATHASRSPHPLVESFVGLASASALESRALIGSKRTAGQENGHVKDRTALR